MSLKETCFYSYFLGIQKGIQKSLWCKNGKPYVLMNSVSYYLENQVFGGVNNWAMSLIKKCLQLYSISKLLWVWIWHKILWQMYYYKSNCLVSSLAWNCSQVDDSCVALAGDASTITQVWQLCRNTKMKSVELNLKKDWALVLQMQGYSCNIISIPNR